MASQDWDEDEHPRDRPTGKFVARTSAMAMLPQAEAWAFDQWYDSPDYGTLDRNFRARDRLVELRMRQLLEPAEYKAWYSERVRQENAKMRARLEREQVERDRRRHRTYRAKRDSRQFAPDEQIRTVRRDDPVRVRVQSPAISERPYRTVVPTRFQPGRRPS